MTLLPRLLLSTLVVTAGAVAAPAAADVRTTNAAPGTVSFNARLRWENADQAGVRESDAVTLATRLGFTTAPWQGLQAMLQGENVAVLNDADDYNAAGTNTGGRGRTVIADPPATDLNQLWASYTAAGNTLKLGRQRIVLDNARFVGDVGWRQNMQTFDAATLTATPRPDFTASYGYVWKVSRVFGNKAPQPDFKSDSHVFNVSYRGLPFGTITAYAYLLDFKNSAANSSNTVGASFAGSRPLGHATKLIYRLEAATQTDAANNPIQYRATYTLAEFGISAAPVELAVGHEELGTDGGRKGFATPLATLHAFNGWADVFLTTPAAGLRDAYASLALTLPRAVPLKVMYHDFRSDRGGERYGGEWDALVTHKLTKTWTILAKYARFDGRASFADVRRFWLQTEYTF